MLSIDLCIMSCRHDASKLPTTTITFSNWNAHHRNVKIMPMDYFLLNRLWPEGRDLVFMVSEMGQTLVTN
jgi:hypothetical protein